MAGYVCEGVFPSAYGHEGNQVEDELSRRKETSEHLARKLLVLHAEKSVHHEANDVSIGVWGGKTN